MTQNVGGIDRILRIVVGLVLIGLAATSTLAGVASSLVAQAPSSVAAAARASAVQRRVISVPLGLRCGVDCGAEVLSPGAECRD